MGKKGGIPVNAAFGEVDNVRNRGWRSLIDVLCRRDLLPEALPFLQKIVMQ